MNWNQVNGLGGRPVLDVTVGDSSQTKVLEDCNESLLKSSNDSVDSCMLCAMLTNGVSRAFYTHAPLIRLPWLFSR